MSLMSIQSLGGSKFKLVWGDTGKLYGVTETRPIVLLRRQNKITWLFFSLTEMLKIGRLICLSPTQIVYSRLSRDEPTNLPVTCIVLVYEWYTTELEAFTEQSIFYLKSGLVSTDKRIALRIAYECTGVPWSSTSHCRNCLCPFPLRGRSEGRTLWSARNTWSCKSPLWPCRVPKSMAGSWSRSLGSSPICRNHGHGYSHFCRRIKYQMIKFPFIKIN